MNAVFRYIVAHWRGEQNLALSCFVNGLVGYLVMLSPLMLLQFGLHSILGIIYIVAFSAWVIWALVGVLRGGWRVLRGPRNSLLRRAMGALALAGGG